jgi:hypothetical protein
MKIFREYIANKSICRGELDTNLHSSSTIKSFLCIMNTGDGAPLQLCRWWEDNVEYINTIYIYLSKKKMTHEK